MSLTGSCFSSESAPGALPSWDSRTRRNNLSGGLAVRRTVGPSGHANSPHPSIDVAHGLVLLFGIGTRGPSIMGFEDEAEQSFARPCRQTNGRSKRTCELTSSIVPRGTSFHRSVELESLLD